jgi:hypothetical protein
MLSQHLLFLEIQRDFVLVFFKIIHLMVFIHTRGILVGREKEKDNRVMRYFCVLSALEMHLLLLL